MAAETTKHLIFIVFSDVSMGFLTQKDTLFCVKSHAVVTGCPLLLPCAAAIQRMPGSDRTFLPVGAGLFATDGCVRTLAAGLATHHPDVERSVPSSQ